jgi:hypothetical protein
MLIEPFKMFFEIEKIFWNLSIPLFFIFNIFAILLNIEIIIFNNKHIYKYLKIYLRCEKTKTKHLNTH